MEVKRASDAAGGEGANPSAGRARLPLGGLKGGARLVLWWPRLAALAAFAGGETVIALAEPAWLAACGTALALAGAWLLVWGETRHG